MKFHVFFVLFLVMIFSLSSCEVEAESINYGKDQCHFCSMNIVDKTHSAQYVTKKGKQFKFDAIECMVRNLSEIDKNDLGIILVADYDKVGNMSEAYSSYYLISKAIKSPMGGNLSAFSTEEVANEYQSEHDGKVYSWDDLIEKYNK